MLLQLYCKIGEPETCPQKQSRVKKVVELVMALPEDRLASVYDFARFVQSHPLDGTLTNDIFGETTDEIRADEEQWEQQFAGSRDELRKMAHEAAAEYRAS